jgi:tetratricopeptide (TPR) repeat protein
VGIANNLRGGMDTIAVLKDTSRTYALTRSVLNFVYALKQAPPEGLRLSSKFYPNEWHGSVELNGEYDGLRSVFKFYRFDMNKLRENPDLNADSLLTAHYERVSAILGYKMLPTEENTNNLAYLYLELGKWDNALALFKRNITNYPESSNAYDSLGDYYAARGDKQNAIAAYSKSLSLQETEDTRRKLNEWKTKP